MKFINKLLQFLYPPRCTFCHRILLHDDRICEHCGTSLPYQPKKKRCIKLPHIDGCIAPFYYEGPIRKAVLRYKFHRARGNADVFARFMAECFREEFFGKIDVITWVPISRKRLKKRGFDQSELLTESLCKLLGHTPKRTLMKVRNNTPQSRQKSRAARRANVMGAYRTVDVDLKGKSVLLIDDVVTTGSTVSECAHVLRVAGAEKVYVLSFAKTPDSQKKIESYQKSGIMNIGK